VNDRAHPGFRIFATQNPSGSSYGGRKTLSRAFRNRFVELHFNELPSDELSTIIEKRCKISGKASKKLIAVMQDLQVDFDHCLSHSRKACDIAQ